MFRRAASLALIALAPIAVSLICLLPAGRVEAREPERSPFEMVRFDDGDVQVMVDGRWYVLVELDGLSVRGVLEACRRLDPRKPEKRFCEDLTAAMTKDGRPLGDAVDLVVTKVGSRTRIRLEQVPVTHEKREHIKAARPHRSAKRIDRKHAPATPRSLQYLQRRHFDDDDARPRLTRRDVRQDLDQLEWLVEHVHSYRRLQRTDYRAAFDAVRAGVGKGGITRADFHIQLRKLLCLFGDGHATVPGLFGIMPREGLPFGLRAVEDGVLAVARDGMPYDRKHPYVRSIDGVSIADWMQAASRMGAQGSPQLRRSNGLIYGCFAKFVRGEVGVKGDGPLQIVLRSPQGSTRRLSVAMTPRARPWFTAFEDEARLINGKVGYVRITRMPSAGKDVDRIVASVRAFEDAKGLILDLRGNPGGKRALLRTLMPHFMKHTAAPVVVNVAALRLGPDDDEDDATDALASRHLHTHRWPGFSKAEAREVKKVLHAFRPDWPLVRAEFSRWHAMVVSPAPAGQWRFTRRIAVLLDAHSFSATDVFAGGVEQLPHVTLFGEGSGGGSGRTLGYVLRNSALEVELSSMASFRPDGRRYDGLGVEPDVEVVETLEDVRNARDPVLARALKHVGG